MNTNKNPYILKFKDSRNLLSNTGNFILNTYQDEYNCGGFALGIPEWFLPYDEDNEDIAAKIRSIEEAYEEGDLYHKEACDELAAIYVDYMCSQNYCRVVKDERDLEPNEYLIAFRASVHDFHYARRMDDGQWYHKMGWGRIQPLYQSEVEDSDWWCSLCHTYESDTFYLAVQKPNFSKARIERRVGYKGA